MMLTLELAPACTWMQVEERIDWKGQHSTSLLFTYSHLTDSRDAAIIICSTELKLNSI